MIVWSNDQGPEDVDAPAVWVLAIAMVVAVVLMAVPAWDAQMAQQSRPTQQLAGDR